MTKEATTELQNKPLANNCKSEADTVGFLPTGQSEYSIPRDSLTKKPGNLSQQRGQKQTQQVTGAP
jgi:hypothetical protein